MWKSELHLIFLGFRGSNGGFLVNLFESQDMDRTYATSLEDFLTLFSEDHLGWIYKLTSHFIFKGPMTKVLTYEAIKSMIEKDEDTEFYIRLADHHIKEALVDDAKKELFFGYIRQFAKVMYAGTRKIKLNLEGVRY